MRPGSGICLLSRTRCLPRPVAGVSKKDLSLSEARNHPSTSTALLIYPAETSTPACLATATTHKKPSTPHPPRCQFREGLTGQTAVVGLVTALRACAWVIPLDLLLFAGNNLWFWAPACAEGRDGISNREMHSELTFAAMRKANIPRQDVEVRTSWALTALGAQSTQPAGRNES